MDNVVHGGTLRGSFNVAAPAGTRVNPARTLLVGAAVAILLAGCDGRSSSNTGSAQVGAKPSLLRLEFGRLVDVFAYRRVEITRPERRETFNRSPVLVQRDVVIAPDIQTQALFDALGEENRSADYRFLPFDVNVGHEELVILWDDREASGEAADFTRALRLAQTGLVEVPASYRSQNTALRPIPLVARNAALKLTFDRDLGLNSAFFAANPSAVQLLEFRADPATTPASLAFRPLPHRVLPRGDAIVLDTSLIGAEASSGQTTSGLPPSPDNSTANIRIAIPSGGVVSSSLTVAPDKVPELNGVGASGHASVIRDFRSGNAADGPAGALTDDEPPAMVAQATMGIVAIDPPAQGSPRGGFVLTLDKRGAEVAVRGRVPFVDGGVQPSNFLPGGTASTPTDIALRSGDIIWQDVVSPNNEVVRIRAEIVANEDVGNVVGDPAFPALGITQADDDGGSASTVRARVSSITAADSLGNPVSFQVNVDCLVRVHYYHRVPYLAGFTGTSAWAAQNGVSDAGRPYEFLVLEPPPPRLGPTGNPIPRGTMVDPAVAVALRFSEPMAFDRVDPFDNLVVTSDLLRQTGSLSVAQQLSDPKAGGLSVVGMRRVDQERNGTLVRLESPWGVYHETTKAEAYWVHLLANTGNAGDVVADLAGNAIELYDRDLLNPISAWSTKLSLDPAAPDNLVGWIVRRFESIDEDGTPTGSEDFFGQFQLADGQLAAAPAQRSSQVADQSTLSAIQRWDKGECWDPVGTGGPPPIPGPPPLGVPPTAPYGPLYQCPSHVVSRTQSPTVFGGGPVTFGGVVEPLNPRGSRLQMTYREDDFAMPYTDANSLMLDIEQMHWAPWAGLGEPAKFDTFDRMTIRLGHADWRPDLQMYLFKPLPPATTPPTCNLRCESLNSGLKTDFAGNVLQGSQLVNVVTDRVYQINPNDAFQGATGTIFIPYPTFEQTYTWRDSRLVTWDRTQNQAVGLGGAKAPGLPFPTGDQTAHVSSPWIDEELPTTPSAFTGSLWTVSEGDFRGNRARDHDPIALPLLLDFMMFPDNAANGFARGANQFHIGLVGPCWAPPPATAGGWRSYVVEPTCGADWPTFRVHTSGGIDSLGAEIFVDPANTFVATGGWVLDPALGDPVNGRLQTKYGDDHQPWGQADFVRRVSMVTYGFVDSMLPNQHNLPPTYSTWPGTTVKKGIPDFAALGSSRSANYAIRDLVTIMDPPLAAQPGGTSIRLEYRFADTFANATTIYDKVANNSVGTSAPISRGNLLNPSYACEAYRYASPNSGASGTSPRVTASGMTPYVEEQALDTLRNTSGLLPRYLNFRLIMTSNIGVAPALSPSLRSLAIVYRVDTP